MLLTQAVVFPEFGNALLSAERMLEQERYAEVVELLRPLSQDKQWHENPVYFLVFYYMGQALFRREMARKRPREKGLDKASSLFTKALEYNPEFSTPIYCLASYLSPGRNFHPLLRIY